MRQNIPYASNHVLPVRGKPKPPSLPLWRCLIVRSSTPTSLRLHHPRKYAGTHFRNVYNLAINLLSSPDQLEGDHKMFTLSKFYRKLGQLLFGGPMQPAREEIKSKRCVGDNETAQDDKTVEEYSIAQKMKVEDEKTFDGDRTQHPKLPISSLSPASPESDNHKERQQLSNERLGDNFHPPCHRIPPSQEQETDQQLIEKLDALGKATAQEPSLQNTCPDSTR